MISSFSRVYPGIPTGWRSPCNLEHHETYGVTREWAVLLPAYTVVIFLLAYFVYIALAIYGAPSFSEMRAVTGQFC